ncbi:MAG: DUF917 domain-containing protein [Deltaproteobacteria bacterium]|nr:DUF917 domain-containing protein [Deltaproteobacteria bacterium]
MSSTKSRRNKNRFQPRNQTLHASDLYDIVRGATLLASGGGGNWSSVQKMLHHFKTGEYYDNAQVEVVTLKEALRKDSEEVAAVVAYIGAPEAVGELKYPEAAVNATRAMQRDLYAQGKTLTYLLPVEIGAISSIVPCLVASKLGLKVIDADGAQRAVPELTMLTYAAANTSTDPTILANADGFVIDLNLLHQSGTQHWWKKQDYMAKAIEKLARPILGLAAFQEAAGLGIWAMDHNQMKNAIRIEGTLELSRLVGRHLAEPNGNIQAVIDFLNSQGLQAYHMFFGIFEKGCVSISTGGGFDVGQVNIINPDTLIEATIMYQNESLLAWLSDRPTPIAMAPDSIAYYVHDSQKVYANGDLVDRNNNLVPSLENKAVSLIGIVANPLLRGHDPKTATVDTETRSAFNSKEMSSSFKDIVNQMGYRGEYIPLEKIWERSKQIHAINTTEAPIVTA